MENNQKKEVNEALHAIEETLGHLSRAQDYLSSAGNWGLFDWMVQSKIKDARFQVDKAIRELNRIKNTLLTLAV